MSPSYHRLSIMEQPKDRRKNVRERSGKRYVSGNFLPTWNELYYRMYNHWLFQFTSKIDDVK